VSIMMLRTNSGLYSEGLTILVLVVF